MSEKTFKPVADAFALIHAGGAPYQWTTNAVEAVAWLSENEKYSVKEYVSLGRYQSAVSDDLAALRQKLDAAESKADCYEKSAKYAAATNKKLTEKMSAMYETIQQLKSQLEEKSRG